MKVTAEEDHSFPIPSSTVQANTLHALASAAWANESAIALWRPPKEKGKHLIIDFEGLRTSELALEELGEGFLFAAFEESKKKIFIHADLYYSEVVGEVKLSPEKENRSEEQEQRFFDDVIRYSEEYFPTTPYYASEGSEKGTEKEDFIKLVDLSLEEIKSGRFQKVVASRTKSIGLSEDFDCIDQFDQLCLAYPNAFISLVSIPGIGTWIGASPEVLINVHDQHYFETVALAGTQKFHSGTSLKQVAWTQKEIEEQALVSRYIINCFKKIRLREFDELGPKTTIAGNLIHLKTVFSVDMKQTNFPLLGGVMLDLLHPTSAVCGMPKEESLDFLLYNEKHRRSFFSGFLGPVNINNNTSLFVNLRCMQLRKDGALLYAGAGITEDSLPEKEWLETEMKCNTLLNVITSNQ